MNEKIAKAFKDELRKIGFVQIPAAVGTGLRVAAHAAPVVASALGGGGGGPKRRKPITGGLK
jgi:hypothetical protein